MALGHYNQSVSAGLAPFWRNFLEENLEKCRRTRRPSLHLGSMFSGHFTKDPHM